MCDSSVTALEEHTISVLLPLLRLYALRTLQPPEMSSIVARSSHVLLPDQYTLYEARALSRVRHYCATNTTCKVLALTLNDHCCYYQY
jgi:hypothetical protein